MRGWCRWRIVGLLLALLGASPWAAPMPVLAGTDHVTTCANSGAGSLPAVVTAASANDMVIFDQDCAGASAITLTGTITLAQNVTIDTSGHAVTVDGGCMLSGGHCTSGGVQMFLVNSSVTATLNGLTIQHGNTGGLGGGIDNAPSATLVVMNSTFSDNTAGGGGGILNGGTLTVTSSTFSGNSVVTTGGGIYNSGPMTVTNTILAGNTASAAGPDASGPASVTSVGHNLVGKTNSSSGWIATDLTGTIASPLNANLDLLQNNGGPTQTMAPLSGSPAIGAGDASVCQQSGMGKVNGVDQRGQPRLASSCDSGAFQTQDTQVVAALSGGVAGIPRPLVVTLLDGYNNLLAPYTGTVHFTSSDPLALLPADYTFTGGGSGKDNGGHGFTVTCRTAGTQTVTVTDTLSGTLTVQVTAAVTPLVSSVGPPSGSTAGGIRVTLSGLGFGTVPANVTVTIGGTLAAVTGVTNSQVVVTAPTHTAGAVTVVVTVNGQSTMVPQGYTYGVVNSLPLPQPSGGTGGVTNPLPAPRVPGTTGGSPNPLPNPRP